MGKGNGTERENNERPGRRGSRGKGSEEGKEVSLVVGAWATTVTDVLTAAASTARPCMQAGTAAASCQCIHSDTCPPMHAESRAASCPTTLSRVFRGDAYSTVSSRVFDGGFVPDGVISSFRDSFVPDGTVPSFRDVFIPDSIHCTVLYRAQGWLSRPSPRFDHWNLEVSFREWFHATKGLKISSVTCLASYPKKQNVVRKKRLSPFLYPSIRMQKREHTALPELDGFRLGLSEEEHMGVSDSETDHGSNELVYQPQRQPSQERHGYSKRRQPHISLRNACTPNAHQLELWLHQR
ncbi:hypothetical protein C4D60_Mb05t08090 [Musa balbisiana]|uniref:Uncharacterized protein n=1 Tax=Musa balbisiana TaxID=52838 RepID=A0A4S8JUK6_MUSBA|nr:hypothetical protein C4D60_Mb05t08090 [Musa balbisiana]